MVDKLIAIMLSVCLCSDSILCQPYCNLQLVKYVGLSYTISSANIGYFS